MAEAAGAERESWSGLRDRRMAEPGAAEAYEAARLAFELGAAVRELRQARAWSQAELASAAGMTQSAVARFEPGGRCRRWQC
jgi:ribosome-binding protein aMBF1 (putative translation factor)